MNQMTQTYEMNYNPYSTRKHTKSITLLNLTHTHAVAPKNRLPRQLLNIQAGY